MEVIRQRIDCASRIAHMWQATAASSSTLCQIKHLVADDAALRPRFSHTLIPTSFAEP